MARTRLLAGKYMTHCLPIFCCCLTMGRWPAKKLCGGGCEGVASPDDQEGWEHQAGFAA